MSVRIALLPAYHPDGALTDLVSALSCAGFLVVGVSDGGKEDRGGLDDSLVVLSAEGKSGKGKAVKTGLSYILDRFQEDCTVVTVDPSGAYSIDDILTVAAKAEELPDTLVIGKRKVKEDDSNARTFSEKVTKIAFSLASGVKLSDVHSGLRAFSGDLIPRLLKVRGDGHGYELNVLLECARLKTPVAEAEIETEFFVRPDQTKGAFLLELLLIFAEVLKFSASSFLCYSMNYALFTVLFFLTGNYVISNVIGRVTSTAVNFTINRFIVFKSKTNVVKAALKFAVLSVLVLIGNTLTLRFFVEILHVYELIAKLIVDLIFFFINFLAQKLLVFRKKKQAVS